MTGSLPPAAQWATGMTKGVSARREYPKRWRDRVQRRGIGDRERHESAVTAVYRAGLDDRGFERSEKPVPIPEGTRGALLETAASPLREAAGLPHSGIENGGGRDGCHRNKPAQ